jgi:ankyrin repeat protein
MAMVHMKNDTKNDYLPMSLFNIHTELTTACQNNDLDLVKFLLTNPELIANKNNADIHFNFDTPLITACHKGFFDLARYLLTSPDLIENSDIHGGKDAPLYWAAIMGHMDIVQYLLTSLELKEHSNINTNTVLGDLCEINHFETIQYLLTSPELTKARITHADIHYQQDCAIRYAARFGHLELVKYLLTSPNLTEHASLIENDLPPYEHVLARPCANGHTEVVKYLLTSPDLPLYGHQYPNMFFNNNMIWKDLFSKEKYDIIDVFFQTSQWTDYQEKEKLILEGLYYSLNDYENKKNQFETLNYFLTHPVLKSFISVDIAFTQCCSMGLLIFVKHLIKNNNNLPLDEGFKASCLKSQDDIIDFFLYDLNIIKNSNLELFFQDNSSNDFVTKIAQKLDMRNLNDSLHNKLHEKPIKHNKVKI